MSSLFDLIVIGSGPAGYVAAIRAAQLGMKTAIIEKYDTLGGTCLNVGCIPSKALLQSSEKYEEAKTHLASHGIKVGSVEVDVKAMVERKARVVKQLTGGIDGLMKKNKITRFKGWGTIEKAGVVLVDGKEKVEGKNILIAVGSDVVELPFAKFDGKTIISSTEALALHEVPKHMIVIGAGVIGLEMGSVWRRLGSKVTLVDIADRPVAVMDSELGKEAHKIFLKQGLEFELGCKVEEVKTTKTGATVVIANLQGEKKELKGDKVLVSVGRYPNTRKLGLEKVGVKTDTRGFIQVDENYRTSVEGIYAVGDCIPGPMLAHKGSEEGVTCVEKLAGIHAHMNYDVIPNVVYTAPEISSVGKTEEELKAEGIAYKSGRFKYIANGRAIAMGEVEGFVKVLADAKTDKLLGVHILGHNASEMIHEAVMVMEFGGSAEDIARSVHAHPTMSEATKEAALGVSGGMLHS